MRHAIPVTLEHLRAYRWRTPSGLASEKFSQREIGQNITSIGVHTSIGSHLQQLNGVNRNLAEAC